MMEIISLLTQVLAIRWCFVHTVLRDLVSAVSPSSGSVSRRLPSLLTGLPRADFPCFPPVL